MALAGGNHGGLFYPPQLGDIGTYGWRSEAGARLGYFVASAPGSRRSLDVTAEVEIGRPDRPFYITEDVELSGSNFGWVSVYGTLYQSIFRPSSLTEPAIAHQRFLEAHSYSSDPDVLRRSVSMPLATSMSATDEFAYIEVEVRLLITRFDLDGRAPADLDGFGAIDLREPGAGNSAVFPPLPPAGAVRLSRLDVAVCPIEVFATSEYAR